MSNWPTDDLTNTETDQGTDNPSLARLQINAAILKIKAMIAGAVSTATALTVVLRDASGDFSANVITAASFIGSLNGNVTGNLNGNATSATTAAACTGNSATATDADKLDGKHASEFALAVSSGSQTFNSSGTFNVPAGVSMVWVDLIGGGGGGGGSDYTGGSGGGGAAGSAFKGVPYVVTPLAALTVTIGAGGSGGGASGASGATGGTSVFGAISLPGGAGGTGGTSSVAQSGGVAKRGVGYSGSGGDGKQPGESTALFSGGGGSALTGGGGGASLWGAGGAGGTNGTAASANTGAGGGGAYDEADHTGGAGGSGKAIIYW